MQSRSNGNVQGIDVSHWQGKINWQHVKADKREFVFIKATQGTKRVDPRFYENVKGARAAGLLVGAYHFLDAITPQAAKLQASHFVETMQKAGDVFELPPVMDYEDNPGNLNRAAINAIALAFLKEVEHLTGCCPMIYTGNSFALNFEASIGAYPLWIARYSNTRVPDDRAAWKRWTIWQYSDSGKVPGIGGNVDLNEFDGTLEELKSWAKSMKKKEEIKEEKPVSNPARDIHVVSPWAEAAWEEMKKNGYVDGSRPGAPITREETAIIFNRMRKNFLQLIAGDREKLADLEKRLQAIESLK